MQNSVTEMLAVIARCPLVKVELQDRARAMLLKLDPLAWLIAGGLGR